MRLYRSATNLISIAHEMVQRNETLEHDDPIRILRPFDEQIGQGGNRDIGLFRAVQEICKENSVDNISCARPKSFTYLHIAVVNDDEDIEKLF